MRPVTLAQAFTDPTLPVRTILPVQHATVPADWRRDATRMLRDRISRQVRSSMSWLEVCGPLESQGGCCFGCKLYARQRGAVVEFSVFHSLTYGHSHSPNAR
jgi:hypothetical protein